jgi:apolipoprotein N-acyltransferase
MAAAAGGGLLIAAALPPAGWWPAAIAGVGLWAWALEGASVRGRLVAGFAAGLTHFLVALAWVPEFTLPGYVLLVLLETAFWTLASALCGGSNRPLALAGALVLAEASRSNFPFEGLPLAGVDLGQAGGPLLGAARLGGPYAVTLAAGLLGAALAAAVRRRGLQAGLALAGTVVLVAVGWVAPQGRDLRELEVAAVQGGGPRGFRGVDTDFRVVFQRHLEAARQIDRPIDLVLWPENSVTVEDEYEGTSEQSDLRSLAATLDAPIIAGVVDDGPPGTFRNAAVLVEPGQGRDQPVFKKIRVPFGEYIPFRSFVERLADLSAIPTEAVPGEGPGLLRSSVGPVAVSISYEVFFPRRSREAVRLGAELMVVPTNAASFRTSQVPGQELAAARVRAVETGRWVVQAAPTGYTGFVSPSGEIVERSVLGEQQVLRATVQRRTGATPFITTGPLPVLLLSLVLLVSPSLWPRAQEAWRKVRR